MSKTPQYAATFDLSQFLSPDTHRTIPLYPLTPEAKQANRGYYLPIRALTWIGGQLVQKPHSLTSDTLQVIFSGPIGHSIQRRNNVVPPNEILAFQTGRMVFTALAAYIANEIVQNHPYGLPREKLGELLLFWEEALIAETPDPKTLQTQLDSWFASMHIQGTEEFLGNFIDTVINTRQALHNIHIEWQISKAETSHLVGIGAETIALLILLTYENSPWRLNTNPDGLLVSKPHADISQHTDFLLRRKDQPPIYIDVTTGDIPREQGIQRVRIQPREKDPRRWINAGEELFTMASTRPEHAFGV